MTGRQRGGKFESKLERSKNFRLQKLSKTSKKTNNKNINKSGDYKHMEVDSKKPSSTQRFNLKGLQPTGSRI